MPACARFTGHRDSDRHDTGWVLGGSHISRLQAVAPGCGVHLQEVQAVSGLCGAQGEWEHQSVAQRSHVQEHNTIADCLLVFVLQIVNSAGFFCAACKVFKSRENTRARWEVVYVPAEIGKGTAPELATAGVAAAAKCKAYLGFFEKPSLPARRKVSTLSYWSGGAAWHHTLCKRLWMCRSPLLSRPLSLFPHSRK